MRIVCPHCQAAYKVDLPELDDFGMDVKCAKCQTIFPVTKEGSTPPDIAAAFSGSSPSEKNIPLDLTDKDDETEPPLPEEYLEDLMDEFVQQEVDKETPPQSSEPKPPDASENLGSLIDGIIQEEPGSQKTEQASPEIPFTEQEINEKSDSLEDPALDDMWEKALQEGAGKPPEDSASELGWEVEPELEPESPPTAASPVDDPDAPIWTDASADQDKTESDWKQAQDQDKALAKEDLQLAEENELSLDNQWALALSGQTPAKPTQEEELAQELNISPPSSSEKPENAAPVKIEPIVVDSIDDSFDDDWMRALAIQATPEIAPESPDKMKIETSADAETEAGPKAEKKPAPVPPRPEPRERPEEPAVGAVMESADEFNTDDLWEQAFNEPSEPEPVAAVEEDLQFPDQDVDQILENVKEEDPRPAPVIMGQDQGDLMFNANEALRNYDESDYADDDEDLFEFQPKKRNRGPLGIPSGKKGDWVIAGFIAALLLIVGGIYFAVETFAPNELTDMQLADTTVPEGLTPKQIEEPVNEPDATATTDTNQSNTTQSGTTPPGTAPQEGPVSIPDTVKTQSLEAGGQDETLITELAKSRILGDSEQIRFLAEGGLDDVLVGGSNTVMMSTIMPVAYNPTDIRILSFSLEMHMSDAASARLVRDALPIYEKIMINTVEDFLKRKFYDDVLYVKENLQKRLLVAMNKSIQGGRVKKTKFTDFAIQ